jgi:putative ABC transport system permease protein
MRFLSFVLRNILRRPTRSALTVLGIAIAVAAVVALVGISHGFRKSFLDLYQRRNVDLVVQQAGSKQRLNSTLPASLGPKMAAIPGVKEALWGLLDMTALDDLETAGGVTLEGWPAGSGLFDHIGMLEGERLKAGDHGKVLLGKILARNLGKKIGDQVGFYGEKFQIQGIYEAGNVFQNGGIVMLLEDLQGLMKREGLVTGFTVVLEHPNDRAEMERVQREIESLGKNVVAMPTREFVNSTTELQMAEAMAWITSAVALVIGTVLLLVVMIMSVFERTREIGILRAIGWRRGRITRMIFMESVILCLAGWVTGTILAIALVQGFSRVPAVANMIDKHIPPQVMAQGFVIALLVGLIGAAYPAYRGAQLLPTEAIRHE